MSKSNLQAQLAELPADPLSQPGTIRLLLSAGASKALTDSGESCFQIVSRASFPACPDRWVILLQPVPFRIAQDACDVILRKATVRRVKAATGQRAAKEPATPAYTP